MGTKGHMQMSEDDAVEFVLSCIFMWILRIELKWVGHRACVTGAFTL